MGPVRLATYADIEALPEHVTGEIIGGVLYTQPPPATPHLVASSNLGNTLFAPFRRGSTAPRSPSTAAKDRAKKLPVYSKEGVHHVWLVDPAAKTLEVFRREGARWLLLGTWADEATVTAEPFDAVPFELGLLWRA